MRRLRVDGFAVALKVHRVHVVVVDHRLVCVHLASMGLRRFPFIFKFLSLGSSSVADQNVVNLLKIDIYMIVMVGIVPL